jgi:peptidoglycan/LPS O-acetylase OafA/YrhL
LAVAVKNGSTWKTLTKLLLVPLLVAPIARLLTYTGLPEGLHFLFQQSSFFCQCDALAYGCIAAVLFSQRRESLVAMFDERANSVQMFGTALVMIPILIQPFHLVPSRLGEMGFYAMQGFGFSILLLQSTLQPHRFPYCVLNWRLIRHWGVLSYSIYIWQQMVFSSATVFGVKDAWWTSFPIWILAALILAYASYYVIERPFFNLRSQLRAT